MSLSVTLPDLHKFILQVNKHDFRGTVLALDPGETMGCAIFHRTAEETRFRAGQIKMWPLEEITNFTNLLNLCNPDHIVFESYHIYGWKSDEHRFSEVGTIQIIGAIKTLAILRGIPYSSQTAQIGKGFCTDDKLEKWGLWLEGLKHARDAARHGVHFLIFGAPKK